jgi:PKD repeat protein
MHSELKWEWIFGDGGRSIEESPTHVYRNNNYLEVTVIVTDSDGDTGSDYIKISPWNPQNWDSDDDGLTDFKEVEIGTDFENPDTDSDGVNDKDDFYPLDPSRWNSPFHMFLQGVLAFLILLTFILSILIYLKQNKKKKE